MSYESVDDVIREAKKEALKDAYIPPALRKEIKIVNGEIVAVKKKKKFDMDKIMDDIEREYGDIDSPRPIRLDVGEHHNQKIVIINGQRKICIMLWDDQLTVSCWADVSDPKKDFGIGHVNGFSQGCQLPYYKTELKKLYRKQEGKK